MQKLESQLNVMVPIVAIINIIIKKSRGGDSNPDPQHNNPVHQPLSYGKLLTKRVHYKIYEVTGKNA
jgi:hypothetical protein